MIIKIGDVKTFEKTPIIYQNRLKGCHKNRINEFLSARTLLLEFLKEKNLASGFDELEEASFQKLKNFPQFTFSFSHTKDQVALVIGEAKDYPYLGIDIEKLDRPLPDSVHRYLDHPEDEMNASLEKWTIKEAAFKFFSAKTQNENFWLKSICLKNKMASFENHSCHYAVQKGSTYLLVISYPVEASLPVFSGLSL